MYHIKYREYDEIPYIELHLDDALIMWDAIFAIDEIKEKIEYFLAWIKIEENRKKDLTITRESLEWVKDFLSRTINEAWVTNLIDFLKVL